MENDFGIAQYIRFERETPNHYEVWDGKVMIGSFFRSKVHSGETVMFYIVDSPKYTNTIIPLLENMDKKEIGYYTPTSGSKSRYFHLIA